MSNFFCKKHAVLFLPAIIRCLFPTKFRAKKKEKRRRRSSRESAHSVCHAPDLSPLCLRCVSLLPLPSATNILRFLSFCFRFSPPKASSSSVRRLVFSPLLPSQKDLTCCPFASSLELLPLILIVIVFSVSFSLFLSLSPSFPVVCSCVLQVPNG